MKFKILLLAFAAALPVRAAVITFESLPLGNPAVDGSTAYTGLGGGHFWNGSNGAGSFSAGGATFNNEYTAAFGSWAGFAYSNTTDNATPGFSNQYSSITGGGFAGSQTYAVGYFSGFGPVIPTITLASPLDFSGRGAIVTNTTYTALDMRNGSGFTRKFGGATGDDPDFFELIAEGFLGGISTGTASFFLADFRFEDNSLDHIVESWEFFDLSALGTADEVRFTFASSDTGTFGINTPTYFALGAFNVIPEPGAFLTVVFGLALSLNRRRCP